jgi:hypothetical protein
MLHFFTPKHPAKRVPFALDCHFVTVAQDKDPKFYPDSFWLSLHYA